MRTRLASIVASIVLVACTGDDAADESSVARTDHYLSAAARRGRDVWFNNAYGGQRFFDFLAAHPDPSKRIRIAFHEVLSTPRSSRHEAWGTINDPDCSANPAGGYDVCPDPNASGVIGIRKFEKPGGGYSFGVACASCHAGFDPLNPPADANEPTWDNIHATIANQNMKFGKIFSHNLAPTDVRRLMFAGWPDGAVDTTALFNDNIMNPGVVTSFWDWRHRPTFDVGMDDEKLRNGQGGEDDVGADLAAIRVYTNIGVCFFECVAPRPDRPNPNAPIDLDQCRRDCADFPPEGDLEDLGAFLGSFDAPRYPEPPADGARYAAGQAVFDAECSSCHPRAGNQTLTDDEVIPLSVIGTNECRARTNKWDAGQLWAAFSSDLYKTRGFKGYRDMPLTGIWATSPFLHNLSIGPYTHATDTAEERAAAYEDAMWELLTYPRAPRVYRTPVPVGPFPAGTPLTFIFSRDPATGALNCADAVENGGHAFGSTLSYEDKDALIYWLKFQ